MSQTDPFTKHVYEIDKNFYKCSIILIGLVCVWVHMFKKLLTGQSFPFKVKPQTSNKCLSDL